MVKLVELEALPLGVVTETKPVVAPVGTVVAIEVPVFELMTAVVALKRREVAPVRFVPVTVTAVPTDPHVGERPVIVGRVPVPDGTKAVMVWDSPVAVYTWIGPVVAPAGTSTVTTEEVDVTGDVNVVLNLTNVGAVPNAPVRVIVVPTAPVFGVAVGAPGQAPAAPVVKENTADGPVCW